MKNLEASLGHTLRCDVVDAKGVVLAAAGEVVTGKLLERIRQAGLEDNLLQAVFEAKPEDQIKAYWQE